MDKKNVLLDILRPFGIVSQYAGCAQLIRAVELTLENPDATDEQLRVRQWQPYELTPERAATPSTEALKAVLRYMDGHGLETLHTATQIIIAPGYEYKVVKAMVTNFHQPQSTLLLLVSAFVHGDWQQIYDYALAHDFRFLSYGDSSLLFNE